MKYAPPQLSEEVEDSEPTIICARAIVIADLISYGENEIAKYIVSQPESDYLKYYKKLAWIASWFLYNVPSGRKDGRSMTFCKAFTLAAIFLHEGAYREPVRKKRNLLHYQRIANLTDNEIIVGYINEIS
jgi:hypothetical protein